MNVSFGKGQTEFGPGVEIELSGEEVAWAILTYLTAHQVHISGPLTIKVNGTLCKYGEVYVDPSGSVISDGIRWSGSGEKQ